MTMTVTIKINPDVYYAWLHLAFGISFFLSFVMGEIVNKRAGGLFAGVFMLLLYVLMAILILLFTPLSKEMLRNEKGVKNE